MKTSLFLFVVLVLFTNCNAQIKESSNMQTKPIEQVLNENQEMLLAVPGVQGFYQGMLDDGSDCIVIMIDILTEDIQSKLPDTLEGYPVVLEAGGKIVPLKKAEKNSSPEE